MIRVQEGPFDAAHELSVFMQPRVHQANKSSAEVGAVVHFIGLVRDVTGGLEAMEIEHYPQMTQKALEGIADEARVRFDILDALIIHRYGRLRLGEQIMMVAVLAPHRRDAFQAADFMMDYLKSRAPFWKKEVSHGLEDWVAAKPDDEQDLARWHVVK